MEAKRHEVAACFVNESATRRSLRPPACPPAPLQDQEEVDKGEGLKTSLEVGYLF
ncbi:Hypothetical protein FKW44_015340 [Caligus rogercresseyi]|uniref:Uncharacterized protein n=1 Tax=Caligus rogercresseyi TaxID=217165 RepID=A0A7T8H119_CALRO|nr:Hypothetical protein FKW44_015340 [Caligus rogercresseyi]